MPDIASPFRRFGNAIDEVTRRWPFVLVRIAIIVVAGYAAAASLVTALAVGLPGVGLDRSEAVVLSSMLGFLIYLALLIWGFAERRLWRLCILLVMVMTGSIGFVSLAGGAG